MSTAPLDVGPPATEPVPSGRTVRTLTRGAARARTGAGWGEVLSDVYTIVFSGAVALLMAMGVAERLGESWRADAGATDLRPVVDPAWVAALGLVALIGALLSLAARLGPVSLSPPEAAWWLPLPVDRRTLLRPAAVRWPLVSATLGALAGAALAPLALGARAVPRVLAVAALAGSASALLSGAAGLWQAHGGPRPVITGLGDGLVAATPVAGLVLLLVGAPGPEQVLVSGGLIGGVALLAGVAGLRLDRLLPRIRDAELRERGAVAGRALGAAVSLDTRELGRALTDASRRQRRRRSDRLTAVRGPVTAVVASDALLLLRSPRHIVQVVVAACLPVAVVLAGSSGAATLMPALVVGGYAATLATAEGARRAETAPVLDRLLPLSAVAIRRVRLVVPATVMLAWSVAVFAVVGDQLGDAAWLALGAAAAPVWAGAALRGAYRPPPDWSRPLVASPFGALPPGAAGVFARGPELVVLGLLPVLVALVVGAVPTEILVVQVGLTALAVAIGSRVPRSRGAGVSPGADHTPRPVSRA